MSQLARGRIPLGRNAGITRGGQLSIVLDGESVDAFEGETVAAVIVARDGLLTRTTPSGQPRGVYCGMGVCFECLVTIDGAANSRACMTLVADGMKINRQVDAGVG